MREVIEVRSDIYDMIRKPTLIVKLSDGRNAKLLGNDDVWLLIVPRSQPPSASVEEKQ